MARQKQQVRKRAAEEEHDSAVDEPKTKKSKQQFSLSTEPKEDDEGNPYWEISNKRRLQVSEFKGNTMISIREYYEKDGKTLPGKGISLPVEQFNAVSELLPHVQSVLEAKGLTVTRPQYSDSESKLSLKTARKAAKKDADEDEDDDEPDVKQAPPAKSKLDKFKLKANHEATSDEDE